MKLFSKKNRVLPGFGLTFGFSIFYISFFILLPISMLFLNTLDIGWSKFIDIVTDPRVMASYKVSFGTAFVAAILNAVFGLLVAWVLVRYRFPGKRIVDAFIDLPFALPTAVAGITLTTLYSQEGWVGKFVSFKIAYTPLGIIIALTFIGLPFVVRMVQPVLENFQSEVEEAAASLGANRFQIFWKVIFPGILPALLTGFSLAFARSLGEYGSVVFISGNMPMKTEITPLLIMTKLEQYDYAGATALAIVLLVISFILLFIISVFQRYAGRAVDIEGRK
ncbi:sulfate ABC transporter permease subunit CysT [Gottfriedia solisilvae]|uniref:Sulfate transport system permease protein CysT n=1 Tax=Gottfriedia solisilvae TaxID=1516104 RepID=A0A8J3ACH0_9BACI|nr:sulfate ABC transporter permease subunit CysT [Gottfriedia solisilvae]GGI11166.1 sulfate ABC transporter permease subunit CysT [Gottfriedia solisilvae]